MNSEFEGLNPPQLQAVHTVDGRVLILAGAGSGKTRVLTMRMVHLVKNLGISPKSILGLTFTNKAAAEMRHRIASAIQGPAAKQVTLCTFHSFCMQVLRSEIGKLGYTQQFSLYDERDVQRLVTLIARDILERESDLPSLAATTAAITHAKNRGLKPEEIKGTGSDWHDEFVRTVYKRLQDSMRAYNAVDFDNLLWLTVDLFEKHPEILEKYQDRFRYIMIDEYQDTNPIQYRLAMLLSAKHHNLCVVGDDDQSIYGWRGAEVKNILSFDNATVIKLEQNYRSTNAILKAANAVIMNNKERYHKALWSTRGDGSLIEVFHAPNEIHEAEAIAYRIAKLKETQGVCWKHIAILYRSNALSRQLELALLKQPWQDGEHWMRGIPFQVFGGVEFYDRREVKDLLAYLRVIVNPRDQEALLRIINQPRRGIGEGALDALTAWNRSKDVPLWDVLKGVSLAQEHLSGLKEKLSQKALNGLSDFIAVIEGAKQRFSATPLHEAMRWLIERIDYQKAVREEVKSDQMRDFKWENVQEFVSAMADYEEQLAKHSEEKPSLHHFITTIPLANEEGNFARQKKLGDDKVNLLTFHSAKGLEFPFCFLVGMEDHIIPHEKSLKETGIEEERRLMYVAITRAMKFLTISMACKRKRMGKDNASKPSRFLFEIPEELIRVTRWDQAS